MDKTQWPRTTNTETDRGRHGGLSMSRDHKRGRGSSRKESETLPPTKPSVRKPSHVVAREEREALTEEIRVLQAQLDMLRGRVGLPTQKDLRKITEIQDHNQDLEEKTAVNDGFVSRLNALIRNELLEAPVNPMATFIHLPREMAQRRAILRGMQHHKLRRAIVQVTQRLHHLDHTMPYMSEQGYGLESGEYQYVRTEILPLPNFQTARQLHDVFVQFLYNLEINVTEMLGQLTLREDMEDYDPTIWNHRMVTVVEDIGVPEELNLVGFAQFYSHSPDVNSPMGITTYETVNVDDLYPYIPSERTCKDIQTAFMACEVHTPDRSEPMVMFKQVHLVVQLPPQVPVPPGVVEKLQRYIGRWPNIINQYLKEYIVPSTT